MLQEQDLTELITTLSLTGVFDPYLVAAGQFVRRFAEEEKYAIKIKTGRGDPVIKPYPRNFIIRTWRALGQSSHKSIANNFSMGK